MVPRLPLAPFVLQLEQGRRPQTCKHEDAWIYFDVMPSNYVFTSPVCARDWIVHLPCFLEHLGTSQQPVMIMPNTSEDGAEM